MDLKPKLHQLSVEMMDFLAAIETDPIQAVHGIRKRSKFLRAVIKLLPEPNSDLKESWKDISRSVAPYRYAHVLQETYQSVVAMTDISPDTGLGELLARDPYILQPYPEHDELESLFITMEKSLHKIEGAKFVLGDTELDTRINATFQIARVQYGHVLNDDTMLAVHALRKKVKRLWYQLRVHFGDPEEKSTGTLLDLSNALGQQLGFIHDLDMLLSRIEGESYPEFIPAIKQLRKSALDQVLEESGFLFSAQSIDLRSDVLSG